MSLLVIDRAVWWMLTKVWCLQVKQCNPYLGALRARESRPTGACHIMCYMHPRAYLYRMLFLNTVVFTVIIRMTIVGFYSVFIARQHTDARYWYSNSVCPSVCPCRSGIRWKRIKILSVFSPYGSPIILLLAASNIFAKFRQGHPLRGH